MRKLALPDNILMQVDKSARYIDSTFLTLILVIFFYLSTQAKATKENLNKWDYIKLKIFCTVEETINKMKQQPTEWEKIVANDISHKGLISRLYRELI